MKPKLFVKNRAEIIREFLPKNDLKKLLDNLRQNIVEDQNFVIPNEDMEYLLRHGLRYMLFDRATETMFFGFEAYTYYERMEGSKTEFRPWQILPTLSELELFPVTDPILDEIIRERLDDDPELIGQLFKNANLVVLNAENLALPFENLVLIALNGKN